MVRSEADSHFRLDDEGKKANRTASRTLMSAMRFYACPRRVCLCGGDDAGVGEKADCTASMELVLAIR